MKIFTVKDANVPELSPVIAVIQFDPWPFTSDAIETNLCWLGDYNEIAASTYVGEWSLEEGGDNMIAILEDGTQFVTRRSPLKAYMEIAGGVAL
jgi:hypothetical protein